MVADPGVQRSQTRTLGNRGDCELLNGDMDRARRVHDSVRRAERPKPAKCNRSQATVNTEKTATRTSPQFTSSEKTWFTRLLLFILCQVEWSYWAESKKKRVYTLALHWHLKHKSKSIPPWINKWLETWRSLCEQLLAVSAATPGMISLQLLHELSFPKCNPDIIIIIVQCTIILTMGLLFTCHSFISLRTFISKLGANETNFFSYSACK